MKRMPWFIVRESTHLIKKQYKAAAEYLTKYLKKNGQDAQAHVMLANTYFQEN